MNSPFRSFVDVVLVDATDEAARGLELLPPPSVFAQLAKGVDDDTEHQVEHHNDHNNEVADVKEDSPGAGLGLFFRWVLEVVRHPFPEASTIDESVVYRRREAAVQVDAEVFSTIAVLHGRREEGEGEHRVDVDDNDHQDEGRGESLTRHEDRANHVLQRLRHGNDPQQQQRVQELETEESAKRAAGRYERPGRLGREHDVKDYLQERDHDPSIEGREGELAHARRGR
eukprot:scaffold3504_cov240-Pinguiococcus_pyrenoidosus.AAC.50